MSKPYKLASFTFKFFYACTSLDHLDTTWFQEIMATPEEAEQLFDQLDPNDFPDRALLNRDELKESFMSNLHAKQIEPVHIGHRGVPGFAWPGLDRHDANHSFLRGARRRLPAAPLASHVLVLIGSRVLATESPKYMMLVQLQYDPSADRLLEPRSRGGPTPSEADSQAMLEEDSEEASGSSPGSSPSPCSESEEERNSSVPMGDDMCLTVKQPFASAVIDGIKGVENRSWVLKLPASGEGRWIFVHAGAEWAGSGFVGHLEALGELAPEFMSKEHPRSCILGAAHVKEVKHIDDVPVHPFATGPQVWIIDRTIKFITPVENVKGAQGLFAVPTSAAEAVAAELDKMLPQRTKRVVQSTMEIQSVGGKAAWVTVGTKSDEPISIDDDEDEKLFGDDRRPGLTQMPIEVGLTRVGPSSTEKWLYEGEVKKYHFEQAEQTGNEVIDDVLGAVTLVGRGMNRTLLVWKKGLELPNPRARTPGHVYSQAWCEQVLRDEDEEAVYQVMGENAPAQEAVREPAATEPAATESAATEPAATEDIPPPPPLIAIDGDIGVFTAENTIKLGDYVNAFSNGSSFRHAGIIVAMETITSGENSIANVTIATDPGQTDKVVMLNTRNYTLDAPPDSKCLFARCDVTMIMTERGVPVDLMDSEVSYCASTPVKFFSVFATSVLDTSAVVALGSTGVATLPEMVINGNVVRTGTIFAEVDADGQVSSDVGLYLVCFSVPALSSMLPPPKHAKMIFARFKRVGRFHQAKEVAMLGPRGQSMATKKAGFNFITVGVTNVTRKMMMLDPSEFLDNSPELAATASCILVGDRLLGEVNTALAQAFKPWAAFREYVPVLNTVQTLIRYSLDGNFCDHVVTTMLTSAATSVSEVVVDKFSKLGTELKPSTLLEAYEEYRNRVDRMADVLKAGGFVFDHELYKDIISSNTPESMLSTKKERDKSWRLLSNFDAVKDKEKTRRTRGEEQYGAAISTRADMEANADNTNSPQKKKKKRSPRGGRNRKRKIASPDPKDIIKPYDAMQDSSDEVRKQPLTARRHRRAYS